MPGDMLQRPAWGPAVLRAEVTSAWILGGIVLLAVLLRVLNHEFVGWVPDTYDRLFDARALAHGQAPDSLLYPPGAALIIAPFFLVLPDSLATMQAITIASGVALLLVAFWWASELTGDRKTALLVALAVSAAPGFVYSARDGLFDTQNLLLTVLALLFARHVRTMPLIGLILYGALIVLLVNLRPNNVLVLPALALLYFSGDRLPSVREIGKAALSPRVLVVGGTVLVLNVLLLVLTDWAGNSMGVPITFEPFFRNLAYYLYASLYRGLGLIFLLPLAVAGARHLWREKPSAALAILYLIGIWPLAYAPFDFTSSRYVLPCLFLVFLLGAIGIFRLFLWSQTTDGPARKILRIYGALSVLVLAGTFAMGSGLTVANWQETYRESDAGLADEFEPFVRDMNQGSLVVSAVSRPLRDGDSAVVFFDLINATLAEGSSIVAPAAVDSMHAAIAGAISDGKPVYYLHSHWEQGQDFRGTGEEGYARYWDAVIRDYSVTAVQESAHARFTGEKWTLYEVTAKAP